MRACADDAVLSGAGDTEPALHALIAELRATADAPAPAPTTALATLLRTGRPPVPAAVPTASRFPLRVRARRVVARAAALGVAGKLALGTGVAFASVGAVATVEAVPDSLQNPASAVVVELVDALTLGTVELTPHGSRPAGALLGGPVAPGGVVPTVPDALAARHGSPADGRAGSGVGSAAGERVRSADPSTAAPGQRVTPPSDRGNGVPPLTVPGNGLPGGSLPAEGLPSAVVPGNGLPAGSVPGKGLPAGAVPSNGLPSGTVPGNGTPAWALPGNGAAPVTVPPVPVAGPPAHAPGSDVAVPGVGAGAGAPPAVGADPGTPGAGAGAGPGGGSSPSDAAPGRGRGPAAP
ncbi:hypothetical protein Q760_03690 [Cellulomonas cellasea DSM 20118]|uniref:Uncharacterized protein n=2 Tax=Cellulomonas cellasea TaxID=43670 RepID=A0A0A0B7A6_9CELL|nr:hypothetical protein Q760_03690 [Cellulomonas cellasea DSM 20118]GEA87551.1 hypothetical protein CCE01nite_15000 [Cellulomonas cellasea]